jgi:hypothetical protein
MNKTYMLLVWSVSFCLIGGITGRADDSKPISDKEQQKSATTPAQIIHPQSPFKFGLDYYAGFSNIGGKRQFNDGFWAGSATALPSTIYFNWENAHGSTARLSMGAGDMYLLASGSTLKQPVEAWWSQEMGNITTTIGKFWVPFAVQEWLYETKPGVMLEWANDAMDLTASFNYNENTRASNTYIRASRRFGEALNIGLSLAAGKGLSYNSVHDRAWGLDGSLGWQSWELTGEFMEALHSTGNFRFAYARLASHHFARWQPFIALYGWEDDTGTFGRFRSTVYGVNYQLTPEIGFEGAYAPTSDKRVWWFQMHFTWQR